MTELGVVEFTAERCAFPDAAAGAGMTLGAGAAGPGLVAGLVAPPPAVVRRIEDGSAGDEDGPLLGACV
ncbi:MAG: hypothetical protein ABIQ09_19850 [Jatrophihabitantaceae bacterium]